MHDYVYMCACARLFISIKSIWQCQKSCSLSYLPEKQVCESVFVLQLNILQLPSGVHTSSYLSPEYSTASGERRGSVNVNCYSSANPNAIKIQVCSTYQLSMMKVIAKITPTQTITPVMRTNTNTISVLGFLKRLVSSSKEKENSRCCDAGYGNKLHEN